MAYRKRARAPLMGRRSQADELRKADGVRQVDSCVTRNACRSAALIQDLVSQTSASQLFYPRARVSGWRAPPGSALPKLPFHFERSGRRDRD
jgi:hypothetical protein